MLWHSFKRELKTLFLLIFLIVLCKSLKIDCLIYKIIGFPCPTCNMTRAMLALLRLDIRSYLSYNAMALPVCTVFVFQLFRDFLLSKKILDVVTIIIMIINFIYYILVLIPKF